MSRRQKGKQGFVISISNDNDDTRPDPIEENYDNTVLGAALLFAGTAMGAGMLALPAETIEAGFIPSILNLVICWAFTYVTALVTLEACWLTTRNSPEDTDKHGSSFLSISQQALGLPGQVITSVLFWFLLTAIVVAYTAEAGQLVAQLFSTKPDSVMATLGSAVFAISFGALSIFGTSRIDAINRIFVTGLLASFIGLVVVGWPQIDTANLFNTPTDSQWSSLYPAGVSIGILSFGAQNVVPTLFSYLEGNPYQTQRAILWGSLLPLVAYSVWEAVFLGIVPSSSAVVGSNASDKMQIVDVLAGQTDTTGVFLRDLVEVFSACAIGSSMSGASVSLVDFFQDALLSVKSKAKVIFTSSEVSSKVPLYGSKSATSIGGKTRVLSVLLALGPAVLLAYAFPDIFLVALEEAGILGAVALYGILPALSIVILRRQQNETAVMMPGRLGGGDLTLYGMVAGSSALMIPEALRLLGIS